MAKLIAVAKDGEEFETLEEAQAHEDEISGFSEVTSYISEYFHGSDNFYEDKFRSIATPEILKLMIIEIRKRENE